MAKSAHEQRRKCFRVLAAALGRAAAAVKRSPAEPARVGQWNKLPPPVQGCAVV